MAAQTPKPLDSKRPIAESMSTAQTSLPQAKPTTRSTDFKQVFLIDGEQKQFSIPERVYKELDSNIVVPDNGDATHEDILKVATLLFLNYVDAATAMSETYGGGGGTGTGWGRDNPTDRTLTYYMDISMEASAGSQIIVLNDLSTNVSSATSSATWLTPTRRTYTSGAPSIMIEVTANTATSNRNCTVTVTAADGNKVIIKVVQKGTSQTSDQPQTNDEVSDQQSF